MSATPFIRGTIAAVGAVVVALALSACQSSPTTASDSASGASGIAAAKAALAEYQAAPTSIGITEKLSALPAGKTVDYMQCGAPLCAAIGDALEEPAKLLGLKLVRIDSGLTADEVSAAWDRAVANHPDAVIGTGTGPELYRSQLDELTARGVPYIALGFPDCDALRDPCTGTPSGVTVNLYGETDVAEYGKLMADWVTVDSNGTGKSAWFYIPDFPLHKGMVDTYVKHLPTVCPGCTSDVQTSKITEIGTGIPTQVVNYVRTHPDVKYVLVGFGDMVSGIPEALAEAGITDVKILTQASGPANYQYMRNGQSQVVDFPVPWDLAAWRSLDIVARKLTGQSLDSNKHPLPRQILTAKDLTFDTKGFWPGVPTFQADFKKLWGVD